jgi:predicted SnoaL-like aldol condensation-catalyzing enzyme
MTKKELAISFLKAVAAGDNIRQAYEKFVSPKFKHHNQYFKGDRETLMTAMEDAAKTSPNKKFEVKYAYEEGDTVVAHSLVQKEKMDIAVVHIMKFEGNKMIEMWDVGQILDPKSPNENGPF